MNTKYYTDMDEYKDMSLQKLEEYLDFYETCVRGIKILIEAKKLTETQTN